MTLEVGRSDWVKTPGRTAILTIGPFIFGADTADGGLIGFTANIGRWQFQWSWQPQ